LTPAAALAFFPRSAARKDVYEGAKYTMFLTLPFKKTKPPPNWRGFCFFKNIGLQWVYLSSLGPFGTHLHREFNSLAFFKIAVTGTTNSRVMDKNIISTFAFNETKTFGSIEPFDGTFNTV
jgi:hypothetical protein